ncbi:MAG: hypothetical protein A3C90_02620 [Candidatus Magasanikbacteria bacterium RIFCSPHIGHO2_02_FULL_51_14]|uniref:Uncharacterized protein n=1 Tax=Candidatus Magasanikbacteria bacterium RIFCSPHIGHO2_02_FULL_51_14 TaxID=1798683 RepID=A0A1F6MEI8_9BACT|nr:MAG: hypothetical protein A3C90_02620 [Candidatus Magasanikbacteria bacterium RIFCSPHIGHO2_02_FULL_51_14]
MSARNVIAHATQSLGKVLAHKLSESAERVAIGIFSMRAPSEIQLLAVVFRNLPDNFGERVFTATMLAATPVWLPLIVLSTVLGKEEGRETH